LRGATLNPEDVGSGSGATSGNVFGIQVDRVVFDELMLMNQEVVSLAKGRMNDSDVAEEVYIANAGGEDETIDLIMKQTDQQFWWRKCGCGTWTCAEKSFPQCVKYYPDADERARAGKHRGYVGCDKCGKPVPMCTGYDYEAGEIIGGEWRPDNPSVKDFEGYNLSHLASLKLINDPASVLEDFINPPNNDKGNVLRLRLGQAYSSAEDKLHEHTILDNCGNDGMAERHEGPCAMGVDVGNIYHIVIGIRTGAERFEIIKVAQVQSFNDIHDLTRRYNVRSTVVDIGPVGEAHRVFQKSERSYGNKVWLCRYDESPLIESDFNENNGIVKAYRTGIFDKSHRYLTEGNIRLPRLQPAIKEFAKQCCNCAKHREEDKYGGYVSRYYKVGTQDSLHGDHYRNALNYFILAAQSSRIRIVKTNLSGRSVEPQFVLNDNQRYI
jgi:hypothetical protein